MDNFLQHLTFMKHHVCKVIQWISLVIQRLAGTSAGQYHATSMDLVQHKGLATVLGQTPAFCSRLFPSSKNPLIGWGRKWSGERAVAIAGRENTNFLLVEDGFLRSIGRHDETLSLVFDNSGIYYDATQASKIEIDISEVLSPEETVRTENLIDDWRNLGLSKYNETREYAGALPEKYVLVLDQVVADMSIKYGLADEGTFQKMLDAALSENPDSTVIVKLHPDVYTRSKQSHFDPRELQKHQRILVIDENCHPVRLIKNAEVVYTVTSQVGFEALIWGKPIRCFGMPFYAGWNLTKDELAPPDRRKPVSILQLVHGALIKYPRYVDPETGHKCEVETVVQHVGLQRHLMSEFPETVYAVNFSRWKIPFLKRILRGSDVKFVKSSYDFPDNSTLIHWGADRSGSDTTSLSVEDGFLRSSGLGAELVQPLSWIVDDLGLYYDVHRLSRLEDILQNHKFGAEIIARAAALRKQIIIAGVSKYNLRGDTWKRPREAENVILVAGQVEGDASLEYGATGIRTNIALLKAVRTANPNSYIVYKKHPDVVAGLRRAGEGDQDLGLYCDEVVEHADPIEMISVVDEVHTMTSLIGFEALLRGVPVTCYGSPFYSGWGLTRDIHSIQGRTRKIDIDMLVAGALIEYPRYISRVTNRFTTPERAVIELIEWRKNGPTRMPIWRRALRIALRFWATSGFRRNA